MTSAAPATKTASTEPKILRIGILQGGKIVEERLLRKRERVTIGSSPKCTFHVPKFPRAEQVMIDVKNGSFFLPVNSETEGRVGVGDQVFASDELRKHAALGGPSGAGHFPLDERARGKLVLGDVTALFQFVTPPPAPVKPPPPPVIKRTFNQWLVAEASIIIGLAISIASQTGVVVAGTAFAPMPVKKSLKDKYAQVLKVDVNFNEKKKIEEKKEEEKKPEEKAPDPNEVVTPKPFYQAPPMPAAPKPPAAQVAQGPKKPATTAAKPAAAKPAGKPAELMGQRRQAVVAKTFLSAVGQEGPGGGPGAVGVGTAGANIATAFDRPTGAQAAGDADAGLGGPQIGENGTGGGAPRVQALSATDKQAIGGPLKVAKVEAAPTKAPEEKAAPRGSVSLSGPSRGGGIGKLDSSAVSAVFKRRASAFRNCYEGRLRDKPNLAGKVVVRFTIGAAGRVTNIDVASNSTGDSPVGSCIVDKVRGMRFDKPANGDVTFTYPIVLSKGN